MFALALAFALWSLVSASAHAQRSSGFLSGCRPPGSKLVDANRYARVYYDFFDEYMVYCRPGDREPEDAFSAESMYPPPAIDLVGPYLGYAGTATEGQEHADVVEVLDVRTNRSRFVTSLQGGVGSLRVNRRGSVAWIVCPNGSLNEGVKCRLNGPSFPRSVYRHDSRSTREQKVQLVASSHRIAIRSLTRRRHRIRWRQAGAIRSASLR